MSFSGIDDFSDELNVDELYTGDVSTHGENSANLDKETKHLVVANSELEADVLYLQNKCKTLKQEICDAAHTEGGLGTVTKNAEIYSTEKDGNSGSKRISKDYINDLDNELDFESKSEDQCSRCLKTQYFEENIHKYVQNFSILKKSPNSSFDFPLISRESVATVNECDSSSLNSIDCSDLFLLEKIDCLLLRKTTPFHPEIKNSIQELVSEMKIILDCIKSTVNSEANPGLLSYFTRIQIIRQCLEKILFAEFQKLKEHEYEKKNFEEYAFCMKSSALKQDKLILSILEQVNSCVKENINLHERLNFLKDKLLSFGLLKPENDAECKNNPESSTQISGVHKISEDYINVDVHYSNEMPNNYMECLQIFKKSSANLQTLSTQATNLQSLVDSSCKLNDNMISRVQDQELHMKGITKKLEEAHNLLAIMKKQHQKLQSTENIVKYDLQEKRRLLNKLKQQLEATRENCNLVRMKNSKSEAEWQDLRREFVQRNKQISEESGFIDDKSEENSFINDKSEGNTFISDKSGSNSFINDKSECDSLINDKSESDSFINDKSEGISFINDNCITDESCFVDNNACENDEPESVLDSEISISTSDIESKYELKKNRLQLLEEQCQILCTNLKNSSKKRKELDFRLESWCKAIENSTNEATKKNNLSGVLNVEKEIKDNPDKTTSRNIDIDFICDVDSSLSSPEIGSFNSDNCPYIPHKSNASSNDFNFSIQSLKNNELVTSKTINVDSSIIPFEQEEHQSVDSDPLSEELNDNCSSKTIDSIQDSSYFGSLKSLGDCENYQMEGFDSDVMETRKEVNGHVGSTKNKSSETSVKSKDFAKLFSKLEEEKNLLQSRCQDLELKNVVILNKLHLKTQELQQIEAAKDQEIASLQFQLNSEILKYERTIKEYNDNNEGLKEMKQKVSDQEQLILTLEEALAEIQIEREGEKEHQWEQLQDIQLALAAREDECISLSSNIQQLEEIKMCNMKDKEMLECELLHLRNDIKELQKKIIKLLREKDILWKTNDRLRYLHKIQIDDRWMADHEVSECLGCRSQFSFLLRKHHCRQCGRIFCHSCSNNWLLTPSSRRQIRVCNECYMQHMEIKTDVRRDSNVQYCDDSEDEAVVDDVSLNYNRSSSFSSEMHTSIADSMISLPAIQVTNLKQRAHFTSAPELHFSHENQEVPKLRTLNDPPLPCHLEVVENDISGNLLIKGNEEAILPILNEVNSTSVAWSLEPQCEAIPISLIYEDTSHCSLKQTVLHQSACETDGVIHLSMPGLYKFHFDNKLRSSSMLVRYSFKANILKEPEISV